MSDAPAVVQLTELQLQKLLRAQAEAKAAVLEWRLGRLQAEETLRALRARLKSLEAAAGVAERERIETTVAIGQALGVDLSQCSFDDITGVVREVVG